VKADPTGVLTGAHFIDGDHAACEGAIAAGCRFVAGYPITPSTEVVERFSQRPAGRGRPRHLFKATNAALSLLFASSLATSALADVPIETVGESASLPPFKHSWFWSNDALTRRVTLNDFETNSTIASIDGTGQSIAVIGRSNIDLTDVRAFRKNFGLPANDPQIVLAGSDPGILTNGDEIESYLDVEWAGALAKNATIKFVVSASTATTDGIYLAAQYAVSHNVAPILSLSYGLCEEYMGDSGNHINRITLNTNDSWTIQLNSDYFC